MQTAANRTLEQKQDALLELLRDCGSVAVAFSAGVDSTVVAKAAQFACGDRAVAVTAVSASLAAGEREAAVRIAGEIGIRHLVLETAEFENPEYVANAGNRCYFCKSELYSQIENRLPELVAELQVDVIVNGANLDDRGDHRPGMLAAQEHAVRSPLIDAGFTKADVRELARRWNLPVWDKPASPCLSSRIAYGVEVTPERVARVDKAERFLREKFGLGELRVRCEANDLARIEVPPDALERLVASSARAQISATLREYGFRYVTLDLDGFRSGSMNAVLPVEVLTAGGL